MRLLIVAGALLLLLFLLVRRDPAPSEVVELAPAAVTQAAVPAPTMTIVASPTATKVATILPTPVPSTATRRVTPTAIPPEPATATPAATATAVYILYEVQAEETLVEIAFRHGVSVEAVVEASGLPDANLLTVGQQLRIPPATAENAPPGLPQRDYGYEIIGFSIDGHALEIFSFGEGPRHVVLVGGMHGGFEWNTVLLAYEMIDYINGNRQLIPPGLTLHIMPVANPDGLYRVTGQAGRFAPDQVASQTRPGRFNGRFVDLNRNWGCGWSASARWGGTQVDPGSGSFSEPETRALRDYLLELQPEAVLFWHSKASLVAPGICEGDAGSVALAQLYADASGYPMGPFTAYELSGTASDWANSQGIPAAAVELTDHDRTEFGQNLAGVLAVLEWAAGVSEEGGIR